MTIRLGVIADDFTGATDVASALVEAGMRVVQTIGIPRDDPPEASDALFGMDAVVVALKSRTVPADQAVQESLEALTWLQRVGARQIYFKYCSTFDSTDAGNIGRVAEALLDEIGGGVTVLAPSYPAMGRTVYQGHLFVGHRLLSESGMERHPLTPMTDPNLVRVLQAQVRGQVALIDHAVVMKGSRALRDRLQEIRAAGTTLVVVDAVDDQALDHLAEAAAGLPLVTGAARLAQGLAANWGFMPTDEAASLPPARGGFAVVAGSVSFTTLEQVDDAVTRGVPVFCLEPLRLATGFEAVVAEALAFAVAHMPRGPVLVHSVASKEAVVEAQSRLGVAAAQNLVESGLARVAQGMVGEGVRTLIVAGGETSGAVVQALGIDRLRIGPQIEPGIPWCAAKLADGTNMHLALKSGNFGAPDFFTAAFAQSRRAQ